VTSARDLRRWWPLAPAALVYLIAFALPASFFFILSFWSVRAMSIRRDFTISNYVETWQKYADVIGKTLVIAAATAVVTTVLAFAFAYLIRFRAGRLGLPLLFVTLLTLFGGYLVKIYAWKAILGKEGVLNSALLALALIEEPLTIFIYNSGAVVATLTHFLLPLAVLPIYGSLRGVEDDLIEAARDLGAARRQAFRDIVLPLCLPGLLTAFTLSFLIAAGDYVTPRFVGGTGTAMIGDFIEQHFSLRFDWPMGSAMSFSTFAASALIIVAAGLLLRWRLRP
jgi:spermidine/putrescine transport system permease protein